jgi:serine/alanine adding enzyme
VEVRVVDDPANDSGWRAFVDSHPGAGAYHHGAWAEVLRRAYGFRPHYLLAESEGRVTGALPAFHTRGLTAGRRLRSLPLLPCAGPLASDAGSELALLEAACRETERLSARAWTLHARDESYSDALPSLRRAWRTPSWLAELPDTVDALRPIWKRRSRNLIRNVGKAEAAGVSVRESTADRDLRAFYGLYLRNMKRLRALPKSYRQIAVSRDLLAPEGGFVLFVAEHAGDTVAGLVGYRHRDLLDLLYIGTDERRLDVRPNHAIYARAFEWAVEQGLHRVDLGVAGPKHSLGLFKAQWGAMPVEEYRYDYVVGSDGPDAGSQATRADSVRHMGGGGSRKARLVAAAWERAPLALTRVAGAAAYRYA